MTAAPAQAPSRPLRAGRPRPVLPGRLLRLELRRNAMLWVLPVAAALFWLITYRKSMALPPLWNVRAMSMQSSALAVFVSPTVGAAAWMGSREGRHGMTDLVAGTARPRWARQLATWAATTCWAMVAYVGCVGVLYAVTARQAAWGGPLWWPAAVGAASLPAFSAVGFVAGTVFPSRFTAPLVAVAAFVGLAFSTLPIRGSQSYWQVSPVVAGAWDFGPNESVGTFYHYLPDLPIAQVISAAGLLAAGTAAGLAGTGRLDAHGMIAIPALHDAANDSPIRYTPVCSHAAIDRKSTRLNSSHDQISYAVFCLKKKKKYYTVILINIQKRNNSSA